MKGRMNRRVFTGSLIGAGAALATGSKLIRPVRAQDIDGWTQKVLAAAARDMSQTADALLIYPPESIDWQCVTSASLAFMAIARQFGSDDIMNNLSGVDDGCNNAVQIAIAEGGWDQYWALITAPLEGVEADFMANFDQIRSKIQSDTWINGTGPISGITGTQGYCEYAPWAGGFEDPFSDDFTRATVNGDPWYQSTSTPKLPRAPIELCCIIWMGWGTEDKCKAFARLKDATIALSTALMFTPLGADPDVKKVLVVLAAIYTIMTDFYCGKLT